MKVERGEWASAKRVKTPSQYTEVKKFYPARCVEGYHVALRHRAMAKAAQTAATGSLSLYDLSY
jgi:hypothetical protein